MISLNSCRAEFDVGNIKIYLHCHFIFQHWDGPGGWNHSSDKTMTSSSLVVNIIIADDLMTQVAKALTAVIFLPNISEIFHFQDQLD